MAISRRPLDVDNYSALDGGNGLAIPGYYRRTNLNDIINNFVIAYVGDGKVLTKIPRYEVAFWAQRAVQEFSYDVFHSEKAIEIQLNTTRQMSLPSDYVNYIKICYTDSQGVVKIDGNKTENTPLGGKCPYTIHVYSVSKDGYSLNYGGAFFIGEILDYAYERDRIVWVTYYMKPS
jgi:hypothetical protein